MNNKGFAITTILYGIMILFCILLVSLLNILSSYKKTQDLLIDSTNGTRDIASLNVVNAADISKNGYCTDDNKEDIVWYCENSNCSIQKIGEIEGIVCS